MSATTDPSAPSAGQRDHGAGADGLTVSTDAATHGRRSWLLLGIGLFQVWLWTTRLVNLVRDPEPRTVGFVVVHAVLYAAAFGAAGVLLAVGWRMRRERRAAQRGARPA